MALAHVQDVSAAATGNPLTAGLALTGVVAGATLVVHIAQTASGTRTYSVSDTGGGTWVEAVRADALLIDTTRETAVWYCANHPTGGSITVNVTHGINDVAFTAGVSEYSGFNGSVTVLASDTFTDTTLTVNHKMSSAGISGSGELLAVGSGVLRGSGTECNPGSGYTEAPNAKAAIDTLFQWRIFASGCSSEVGAWTNTVTNRASLNAFCLLASSATILTPAAGSLAITGYAPTLKLTLTPAAATLSITGYAPTLKLTLTPAAATLAITGFAPTPKLTVPVPQATLTVTGFAPTLTLAIPVPQATLALTGYAPALEQPIPVSQATLTVTGFAPELQTARASYSDLFRAGPDPAGGALFRSGPSASGGSLFR